MTEKITTPVLPDLKEILEEFESGKIPRSSTWQHLISGLYLNANQVQEIEDWYKEIQDWYSATVEIKEGVNGQYIQIEIWQKDIENNVNISKNTIEEIKSFKEETSKNALQAESEADRATDQANRSTIEADRSETAANRSEGVKKVNEINPDIHGNVDISWDNLKDKNHLHKITDIETVGTILGYASPTPPTGWALCDGSFFDKNKAPDLYEVLNDELLPFIPPENSKWSIINHGYDGDITIKLDITSWSKLPKGLNSGSTNTIWALAASGSTFVAGLDNGYASISTDSGRTWQALPRGLNTGSTERITVLAASGNIFVAGFDTDLRSVTPSCASISIDCGRTWEALPQGLNSGSTKVIGALVASGSVFVAGVGSGYASISTDSGRTWQALPRGLNTGSTEYIVALAASESTFVAGLNSGYASISTDSGRTWEALPQGLNSGSIKHITALAASGSTFVAGMYCGYASISTDGGRTWQALPQGLNTGSVESINALTASGNVFVAGLSRGYASISTDGGRTWKALPRGLTTGSTNHIVALAASESTFIAGCYYGDAAIGTPGPTLYSAPPAEVLAAENKISKKDREVVMLFQSDPQLAFEKLVFENIRGNETLEELDDKLNPESEKED